LPIFLFIFNILHDFSLKILNWHNSRIFIGELILVHFSPWGWAIDTGKQMFKNQYFSSKKAKFNWQVIYTIILALIALSITTNAFAAPARIKDIVGY